MGSQRLCGLSRLAARLLCFARSCRRVFNAHAAICPAHHPVHTALCSTGVPWQCARGGVELPSPDIPAGRRGTAHQHGRDGGCTVHQPAPAAAGGLHAGERHFPSQPVLSPAPAQQPGSGALRPGRPAMRVLAAQVARGAELVARWQPQVTMCWRRVQQGWPNGAILRSICTDPS